MSPAFKNLNSSESSFVAFTLMASRCYRLKQNTKANFYDLAAHRLYGSSDQAYASYHFAYCLWRDSGFSDAMFSMILHFLGVL